MPEPRVMLRHPLESDRQAVLDLRRASWEFLQPWEPSPAAPEAGYDDGWFDTYLAQADSARCQRFLALRRADGQPLGSFNASEIVRGVFHSAYLGYWIGAPFARQGYATEALDLLLERLFDEQELHRVEANVRPENEASLALVRRLGFRREGLSRAYLRIAGAWCDHERWALLADEWRAGRRG